MNYWLTPDLPLSWCLISFVTMKPIMRFSFLSTGRTVGKVDSVVNSANNFARELATAETSLAREVHYNVKVGDCFNQRRLVRFSYGKVKLYFPFGNGTETDPNLVPSWISRGAMHCAA
jgi:hypothetical protein